MFLLRNIKTVPVNDKDRAKLPFGLFSSTGTASSLCCTFFFPFCDRRLYLEAFFFAWEGESTFTLPGEHAQSPEEPDLLPSLLEP